MLAVSFRIFFSPVEITRRVRAIVESQKAHYNIQFREASLQLANGFLPQLAIQLEDVSFSQQSSCGRTSAATSALATADSAPPPAVKMMRLRVPFRFWRFLSGHIEAGEIEAEDVMIDLDRLRDPCITTAVARLATPSAESRMGALGASPNSPALEAGGAGSTKPWWTSAQIESLRAILRGVRFHRVDLRFETKHAPGKQVRLEDFSLLLGEKMDDEKIRVSSYLRVPPELTYGEELPPFSIEGFAQASVAEVNIKADMSEGSIESFAKLRPGIGGRLMVETKATVSDLPLSTTMPLFMKSGLIQKALRPKFLWLNCGVAIKGEFQGLLEKEPLFFERCSIEGNGAKIQLASAVRYPDGHWAPFQVDVTRLDLKRVFETFSAKGPDGIASDYGRITGHFKFDSPAKIQFTGALEGAAVHFSSHNLRAIQTVTRMNADVELRRKEMHAKIESIELLNGNFKGHLDLEGDTEFRHARVKLLVDEIALDPSVQRLLVNGEFGAAKGKGEAEIRDGRLESLEGDWFMDALNGRNVRLRTVRLQTKYKAGEFSVQLKSPLLMVNQDSGFFGPVKAAFFDHHFHEPWIEVRDVVLHGLMLDNRQFEWDRATGSMEDGQIGVSSSGRLTREQSVEGWVMLDYPNAKKLRWMLSGEAAKPSLKEESKSLIDLHKKGLIDDRILGLKSVEP